MNHRRPGHDDVPAPTTPSSEHELRDGVTFFVTRAERRALLVALRAIDRDRSRALLRALGLRPGADDE